MWVARFHEVGLLDEKESELKADMLVFLAVYSLLWM